VAELYNEALRYATEGHLRLARERLGMVLCMAPDDGEARVMLARVHVAGQRWQDALAALDEATAAGQPVPMSLRRAVEDHLRAEQASRDEQTAAVRAREHGELSALREEARRLRSEHAQLTGRSAELEKETRRWAWTTAAVSSLAIVFIMANLLFGGSSETIPAEDLVGAQGAPASAIVAEQAAPPPPARGLAEQAAAALAGAEWLADTDLSVAVRDGKAIIRGQVISAEQRNRAAALVQGVEGIVSAEADSVQLYARVRGTEHTVVGGDTLSHISTKYYGSAKFTKQIQKANKGSLGKGGTSLKIGQVLRVPPVD
jgi:nucleoid-associated protein YgaU